MSLSSKIKPAAPQRAGFLNANLKRRLLTAAIGVPVLLLAVLGGLPWVSAITLLAAAVGAWEIARLSGDAGARRYVIAFPAVALVATGVAVAGLSGNGPQSSSAPGVFAGAAAALGIAAGIAVSNARPRNDYRAVLAAVAAVYFGALLAHGPGLAARENGRDWLLIALLGTFAIDSAAYFAGRAVGRRKLAPRISPSKTWEGAFAGLAAGPITVIAFNALIGPGIAAWQAGAIGLAVSVGGIAGDLAESGLKRAVGVKDSGVIVPGHGGILDRIDSLAPNLAIVYWAAAWTGA